MLKSHRRGQGPGRSAVGVVAGPLLGAMVLALWCAAPVRSGTDPERLKERNALAWEALRLREAGKTAEGIVAAEKMLAVERRLFADGDEDLAGALEFVAGAHTGHADFERAIERLEEALAIREKALGKDHWQAVDTRFALGRLDALARLDAGRRGRYREGMRLVVESGQLGRRTYEAGELLDRKQKAVAILKEALGEESAEYALYLEQLGWLYRDRSATRLDKANPDYQKAAATFRQVLEIRQRALGEFHPDVAKSLESLADYPGEGDGADFAGTCLRRALEIRVRSQGERHPDVARTLSRLSEHLARAGGEKAEALGLCERALTILEAARGMADPGCLPLLQRIATLAEALGDRERQEQSLLRRLEAEKARLDAERSPFASTWIGRLGTPPDQGALRFAHRWSAFAMRESHAMTLGLLSRFHGAQGNLGRAGQYLREAVNVHADNLERHAAVAQDQHHFDPMSSGSYVLTLDRLLALSLDPRAEITADEAYRQMLAWKGGYFAHELRARRWRDRPETAALARGLREAADRLSLAALASPAADDREGWDRILRELGRRDRLEAELADRVSELGAAEARERPDVERLKAALPADAALVDFKVFTPWIGWGDMPRHAPRLMAFVVRHKGPVERLDLGPWLPMLEMIRQWRRFAVPPGQPGDSSLSPRDRQGRAAQWLAALRRQLWNPLTPHLGGVATLLVSPDAALCKFPMAALPGSAPGSYLVEDLAIAVVPVPRLLLDGPGPAAPEGLPRLLAVGDVDYDGETGALPARGDRARRGPSLPALVPRARVMKFGPLDSTAREVEAVRARFASAFPGGNAILLRGTEATEGAFRKALAGSRFVHLATHGFFEPPELAPQHAAPGDALAYWSTPQGLVRLSPGLLSGVAFAGANRPPAAGHDDGLLTAVEAQQLDLGGVDLVVLSACETALGSEARGEGLMGLQRAFQVAGARTLVSSLWPVDDAATTVLMEEFYANLWRRRLPKLEALRQAQLALLRRYEPARQALRQDPVPGRRLSPDLWAAFTLSGDWR